METKMEEIIRLVLGTGQGARGVIKERKEEREELLSKYAEMAMDMEGVPLDEIFFKKGGRHV